MTSLAIIVPMLGRPHRVVPLLASIEASTPQARVLFAVNPLDDAVSAELDRVGADRITIQYHVRGDYARKINAGYRATTEDVIFTGADDLEFRPGWYEACLAQLKPGIGVVGTNDLGSPRVINGEHSTHSLITRDYIDRFGILDWRYARASQGGGQIIDVPGMALYEGYPHEWVDDELVGTARHRNAYAHAHTAEVAHLHPFWVPGIPMDKLYSGIRTRMRQGRATYERRVRLWT